LLCLLAQLNVTLWYLAEKWKNTGVAKRMLQHSKSNGRPSHFLMV